MKHTDYTQRKSFKKWGMPGQRVMTQAMQARVQRHAKRRLAWEVPIDFTGRTAGAARGHLR